jgi:hypothetical protein
MSTIRVFSSKEDHQRFRRDSDASAIFLTIDSSWSGKNIANEFARITDLECQVWVSEDVPPFQVQVIQEHIKCFEIIVAHRKWASILTREDVLFYDGANVLDVLFKTVQGDDLLIATIRLVVMKVLEALARADSLAKLNKIVEAKSPEAAPPEKALPPAGGGSTPGENESPKALPSQPPSPVGDDEKVFIFLKNPHRLSTAFELPGGCYFAIENFSCQSSFYLTKKVYALFTRPEGFNGARFAVDRIISSASLADSRLQVEVTLEKAP